MSDRLHPVPLESVLATAAAALARFRGQIPDPVLDELRQETAARVLASSEPIQRYDAYTRRVARHLAIDWLRRRWDRHTASRPADPPDATWHNDPEACLSVHRLLQVLERAPAPHREVLVALFVEERELADLVMDELCRRGCAPDEPGAWSRARATVYKRRDRALGWLRLQLGGEL